MDGLALLRQVSDAYRNLRTLALEAALIIESGDENSHSRGERRVRFFYAAPDRMRYEPNTREGQMQVADGAQVHTVMFLRRGAGGTKYASTAQHQLPYVFNPMWPGFADAFLFQGIDEQVLSAEILREEDGCSVVAVTHDRPQFEGWVNPPPVLFWVDHRNHIIMRRQDREGFRFPNDDEVFWHLHTMMVREIRVNEPIPEETFQLRPPPDATADTGPDTGDSSRTVSWEPAIVHGDPNEKRRFNCQQTSKWEGDSLVNETKIWVRGMSLNFERHLTFSEDGTELSVEERVSGPKGEVQTSCKLPIA